MLEDVAVWLIVGAAAFFGGRSLYRTLTVKEGLPCACKRCHHRDDAGSSGSSAARQDARR